ncbi:BUD13-like protein [Aphelenchoides bicaudatus]|nr:BUD13-like protein [Aphelenchoides bicaudatus]
MIQTKSLGILLLQEDAVMIRSVILPPPRKQRRHDSNEKTDRSPPRRRRHDSNDKTDRSPPRRRQRHDSNDKQITIKQEPNDSSPPRRRHDSSNEEVAKKQKSPEPSPPQQRRRRHDSDRSITPPPTRPQYGRAASPSQNQAVLRRKRITKEQEARTAREAKKQQELDEKYAAVSKGVAQDEQRQQKIKEMEQTVEENFTRYADDEAMNTRLKGQLLGEDDPMNEYMSKKVYPSYRGQFPQNRYEIPPGYRWDGVDRSNGFEKKMGAVANRKIAENSAAYRAVTEMAE